MTRLFWTLCFIGATYSHADPPVATTPCPDSVLIAIAEGKAESLAPFLNEKQDVNAANGYGVTPLGAACLSGQSEAIEMLLSVGANPNGKLPGKETPLMWASRAGSIDGVRHLIAAEADVNAKATNEQTALMWAAAAGHVDVVSELLSAGADVEAALSSGFTPLLFAAREGRMEVVRRLLDHGVDVNATMKPKRGGERAPREGMSALLIATESGHFDLAIELVRRGADPNDERSGYAPLHAITWVRKTDRGDNAAGDAPPRGSGGRTSLQFVRDLVATGADVNLALRRGKGGRAKLNHRGATPFLLASKTADLPLLQLLHELGADPALTNIDGTTPIMAAAGIGVVAVGEEAGTEEEVLATIDFLVSLGADPNVVDKNDETAMHGAAYRNFPRVVTRLAEHGAVASTWDHKNKWGWTPNRIAEGYRPGSFKPSPETIAALNAARK